jgi:hypothetical protein
MHARKNPSTDGPAEAVSIPPRRDIIVFADARNAAIHSGAKIKQHSFIVPNSNTESRAFETIKRLDY